MDSLGALLFASWVAAQLFAVIYLRNYAAGDHVRSKEHEAPGNSLARPIDHEPTPADLVTS